MAINPKIVRKIQLLLNKTKNNPSKEEVQTALLMAQRFMAEYGITQAEVDTHQDEFIADKKVTRSDYNYENLPWYKRSLSRVIANNFRCYSYINKRNRKSRVVFLGLEQDVELAKMTFDFACGAIKYGANQFAKEIRKERFIGSIQGVKNSYMLGWIKGLEDQYKEQVAKNNWGLILVKDALVKREYENMSFSKRRSSSISVSGDSKARNAGYRDGKIFSSPSGRLRA